MDANDRLLSLAYRLMFGEFRLVDQARDKNLLKISRSLPSNSTARMLTGELLSWKTKRLSFLYALLVVG